MEVDQTTHNETETHLWRFADIEMAFILTTGKWERILTID